MTDFLEQFTQELRRPNPLPERLALAIAGMAYPALDMAAYEAELDALAEQMREALSGAFPGRETAEHFLYGFNTFLGFRGNREQYYDPRNSFLNVVIDQRQGLPISLCLICLAIGRRLGLRVDGMGFPGHFMARYQDGEGAWLLDPFYGQVIALSQVESYLARIFNQPVNLPPMAFGAVTPGSWAQRILNNLRNAYLSENDFAHAVGVLAYMLALMPNNPNLWRERGLLHHRLDNWEQAAHDLRRYFFLNGNLLVALAADSQDHGLHELSKPEQNLVQLLRQIEEHGRRLN